MGGVAPSGRAADSGVMSSWEGRVVVVASVATVFACAAERPPPPHVMATATPPPSASVQDAAAPAETDQATTSAPDAAAPGPPIRPSQRPPPTEPPSIFRRISAGFLPVTALRETWTLSRHGAERVLLLSVDESTQNLLLDGQERDESNWKNIAGATWSANDGPGPRALRLEESHGVWGRTRGSARPMPNTLTMNCKAAKLPVLSGAAVLVHGDACGNGGPRPYWKPKERTTVSIERCAFDELPQDEHDQKWNGLPSFAREPGVEFVFENSDCTAQEGAYRQIGPAKR